MAEDRDELTERLRAADEELSAAREDDESVRLGVQADAQRRQADLPAAIAARRWLISEFADVRPRNRPDLVFDHRLLLAEDLFSDGQVSEAAVALSELMRRAGGGGRVESQLRAMDTRATSELSAEAPPERARGWSSLRSRGRG
jgi:hypothetical protein